MTQAVVQVRNIVARSGFANPLTLEVLVTDEDYLKVYADTTLLDNGPDYEITGIGDPNGVSIEIIGAEDVDNYVGVISFVAVYEPPLDQQASLSAGGVLGRSFESGLDQQNRRLQSIGDRVLRSIKMPVTVDGDIVLDEPVDQWGLVWDDDTQAFIWAPVNDAGSQAASLPIGGTTGQLLRKASDSDFDTEWVDGAFTADAISFTPGGGIAAVTVQGALEELDTEKLSVAAAAATYLTTAVAAATYLTIAAAAATYLTAATAASTYLTQANAASTYLTQANAATAYVARPSPTVDNTLARFNGTSGQIQASGTVLDDDDKFSIVRSTDAEALRGEYAQMRVSVEGPRNAIVGVAANISGSIDAYPTGVTGIGINRDAGNQAFGVYAEARAYATGVVTNEFASFNYNAAPPTSFFPSRAFGIANTLPINLTVGAGGTFQSHTAIQIVREGSDPNSFLHGLTIAHDAVTEYAIIIDADATTSAKNGIYIKNKGNTGFPLRIDTTATLDAAQTIININNASTSDVFNVKQNGALATKGRISNVVADDTQGLLIAGATKGFRIIPTAAKTKFEGVDNTGALSYQPISIGGSTVAFAVSDVDAVTIDANKNLLGKAAIRSDAPTSGVGYATGAGGTVTQLTSKSTGVTLSKVSGQITTHNASLGANTTAIFTVTNTAVAATDTILLDIGSGGTAGAYQVWVTAVGAGSFNIAIRNISAGALGEAVVINFAVLKAVTS
jgi:hypothetical protein